MFVTPIYLCLRSWISLDRNDQELTVVITSSAWIRTGQTKPSGSDHITAGQSRIANYAPGAQFAAVVYDSEVGQRGE